MSVETVKYITAVAEIVTVTLGTSLPKISGNSCPTDEAPVYSDGQGFGNPLGVRSRGGCGYGCGLQSSNPLTHDYTHGDP